MSLFVCSNCGTVENDNLITTGLDNDRFFPNMHLMDMHGLTKDRHSLVELSNTTLGDVKEPEQVVMLCSECNTGTWHGEFSKSKATVDELLLCSVSDYRYITPFDHKPGYILKDDDAPHGYRLGTIDEIENIQQKTDDLNGSMKELTNMCATLGVDINAYIKSNKTKKYTKPTLESKRSLTLAEYKRALKKCKRDKDVVGIHKLNDKITALKDSKIIHALIYQDNKGVKTFKYYKNLDVLNRDLIPKLKAWGDEDVKVVKEKDPEAIRVYKDGVCLQIITIGQLLDVDIDKFEKCHDC